MALAHPACILLRSGLHLTTDLAGARCQGAGTLSGEGARTSHRRGLPRGSFGRSTMQVQHPVDRVPPCASFLCKYLTKSRGPVINEQVLAGGPVVCSAEMWPLQLFFLPAAISDLPAAPPPAAAMRAKGQPPPPAVPDARTPPPPQVMTGPISSTLIFSHGMLQARRRKWGQGHAWAWASK
jgi:hypothetical protein